MILRDVTRGEGGPLVMLHGLFGRAANFGAAQSRLATRRGVVALDLRGHGNSPHGTPIDYPTMAADVAETLHALGAWPCDLLGHSMGGKVAMTLALTQPQAVRRLIVADIAPLSYPSRNGPYARAMLDLPLRPGLSRAAADTALAPAVPDAAVRRFLLQNFRPGEAPGWSCDLTTITAALPNLEAWPETSARFLGPSLFLAGGRSDYVPEPARSRIFALFPAARLSVLEEAGHWLHADDPEGFLAAIEQFLAQTASAG